MEVDLARCVVDGERREENVADRFCGQVACVVLAAWKVDSQACDVVGDLVA